MGGGVAKMLCSNAKKAQTIAKAHDIENLSDVKKFCRGEVSKVKNNFTDAFEPLNMAVPPGTVKDESVTESGGSAWFEEVFSKYAGNGKLNKGELNDLLQSNGKGNSKGLEVKDGLTLEEFKELMFHSSNDAFKPRHDTVFQDMSKPLSHYYINCSHNTYIGGNQILDKPSPELYTVACNRGARCVELDVYDGDGGEPVLKHGKFTLEAPAKEVLEELGETGFNVTPYPLFIQVENYMSEAVQGKFAEYCNKFFGDRLVKGKCGGFYKDNTLPSPEELKNKVIMVLGGSITHKDLIEICHMKPFGDEGGEAWRMRNSAEDAVLKDVVGNQDKANEYVEFTNKQLCRVYPAGHRVNSSNFNPMIGWSYGAQLCAMNTHNDDSEMFTHQGFFRTNGRCGLVLKPELPTEIPTENVKSISVKPICLSKPIDAKGDVSVDGYPGDDSSFETTPSSDLTWDDEPTSFGLKIPAISVVKVEVFEKDSSLPYANAAVCVRSLRKGIRNFPLKDKDGYYIPGLKLLAVIEHK